MKPTIQDACSIRGRKSCTVGKYSNPILKGFNSEKHWDEFHSQAKNLEGYKQDTHTKLGGKPNGRKTATLGVGYVCVGERVRATRNCLGVSVPWNRIAAYKYQQKPMKETLEFIQHTRKTTRL